MNRPGDFGPKPKAPRQQYPPAEDSQPNESTSKRNNVQPPKIKSAQKVNSSNQPRPHNAGLPPKPSGGQGPPPRPPGGTQRRDGFRTTQSGQRPHKRRKMVEGQDTRSGPSSRTPSRQGASSSAGGSATITPRRRPASAPGNQAGNPLHRPPGRVVSSGPANMDDADNMPADLGDEFDVGAEMHIPPTQMAEHSSTPSAQRDPNTGNSSKNTRNNHPSCLAASKTAPSAVPAPKSQDPRISQSSNPGGQPPGPMTIPWTPVPKKPQDPRIGHFTFPIRPSSQFALDPRDKSRDRHRSHSSTVDNVSLGNAVAGPSAHSEKRSKDSRASQLSSSGAPPASSTPLPPSSAASSTSAKQITKQRKKTENQGNSRNGSDHRSSPTPNISTASTTSPPQKAGDASGQRESTAGTNRASTVPVGKTPSRLSQPASTGFLVPRSPATTAGPSNVQTPPRLLSVAPRSITLKLTPRALVSGFPRSTDPSPRNEQKSVSSTHPPAPPVRIKTEPGRDISLEPQPQLVNSGVLRYARVPSECRSDKPNYQLRRQEWVRREAAVLKSLNLSIQVENRVVFREDGMVLEWSSPIKITHADLEERISANPHSSKYHKGKAKALSRPSNQHESQGSTAVANGRRPPPQAINVDTRPGTPTSIIDVDALLSDEEQVEDAPRPFTPAPPDTTPSSQPVNPSDISMNLTLPSSISPQVQMKPPPSSSAVSPVVPTTSGMQLTPDGTSANPTPAPPKNKVLPPAAQQNDFYDMGGEVSDDAYEEPDQADVPEGQSEDADVGDAVFSGVNNPSTEGMQPVRQQPPESSRLSPEAVMPVADQTQVSRADGLDIVAQGTDMGNDLASEDGTLASPESHQPEADVQNEDQQGEDAGDSTLINEFIRRYAESFDGDRSTLAGAYCRDATFSYRFDSRTKPPERKPNTFLPPTADATSSHRSELQQGHLSILRSLYSFGSYTHSAAPDADKEVEADGHSVHAGCTITESALPELQHILLSWYAQVGLQSPADGSGCDNDTLGITHAWILRRPTEDDACYTSALEESEKWPLVAVSHQMVIRELLEGDELHRIPIEDEDE